MSVLGSIIRGASASAVGTLAMDTLLYRRYRGGGGRSTFLAWESSESVDSWDRAPAPALVAKRLLERVTKREVPARYVRILNNATHWGYGLAAGAGYGLIAGSRKPSAWYGLPFGATVWVSGYVVLPVLGVYEPIWKYDVETLENDLSAHLVFGTATAATFWLLAVVPPTEGALMGTAESATRDPSVPNVDMKLDMKLEVVVIPVADPDRSKAFYERLGWRLDADFAFDNGFRVIQLTPPGSTASIQFGSQITAAPPGSARGLYLVVSDIQAARDALAGRGVEIGDVFHPGAPGAQFAQDGGDRVSGSAPEHASYGSFATFSDPDGNGWLLQEVTQRLPGRTDAAETTFASTADLANAMRRASVAHGEHEKRMGGEYDVNWPDWYAAYMVAEQAGTELPT